MPARRRRRHRDRLGSFSHPDRLAHPSRSPPARSPTSTTPRPPSLTGVGGRRRPRSGSGGCLSRVAEVPHERSADRHATEAYLPPERNSGSPRSGSVPGCSRRATSATTPSPTRCGSATATSTRPGPTATRPRWDERYATPVSPVSQLFVTSEAAGAGGRPTTERSRSSRSPWPRSAADYLDLYLIHAPWPWDEIGKDCRWRTSRSGRRWQQQAGTKSNLASDGGVPASGRVKAIGVSNDDLDSLLPACTRPSRWSTRSAGSSGWTPPTPSRRALSTTSSSRPTPRSPTG